jgi:hypothetical protein
MFQGLNSLTNDYELKMVPMKKHIGRKENPLTIDERREVLSLRFERLS